MIVEQLARLSGDGVDGVWPSAAAAAAEGRLASGMAIGLRLRRP